MTRLFFDCEFIEDGHTIDLVSIGIVAEDGEAIYYAEPLEADLTRASDWVWAHVLPYLTRAPRDGEDAIEAMNRAERVGVLKPRSQIADEILAFAGPMPEWWGYVAHYDWVVLRQMYGRMVDMPAYWPFGCHDLDLMARLAGIEPEETVGPENQFAGWEHLPVTAHHAMPGALWTKALWDAVQRRAGDEPDLTALVATTSRGTA